MSEETKETILRQKYSQRDAFWSRIGEIMKDDQDVVIVVADMSTPVFDKIRKEFSNRFFNVGIAEQNAVLVASGLAMQGKKVFVYAIASFMVLRSYEQIRVANSIMGIPITIVGVGAGLSYDNAGPTHHLFEDIAVMRVLPNMTTYSITDNVMARKVAEMSIDMDTPNYVRLERHVEPDIYDKDTDFTNGFIEVRSGGDGCIISTGIMVRKSLKIAERLENNGINLAVIDMHTIPCQESLFIEAIKGYSRLVTIEEHFLPGGMGSYVLEILSDNSLHIDVKRFGLTEGWCYRYGGREDNHEYHGLHEENLIIEIEKYMKRKIN